MVYCTIIRTICATLVSNSSLDRRRLSKQLGSSSRFSSGRWCSCWSGRSARGNFPTYGSIWGCAKQVSTTPTYRVKLCSEAPWLPRIYTCVHARARNHGKRRAFAGETAFQEAHGVVTRRVVLGLGRREIIRLHFLQLSDHAATFRTPRRDVNRSACGNEDGKYSIYKVDVILQSCTPELLAIYSGVYLIK